jgi:ABC-type dipeptide/oligopeptide/nickel transport system ATPase subunit
MSLLRKAKRSEAKLKLGLSGPSGSGKTYSSLLLAKGLMGSLDDVAILDTENGSADLYAHLGSYSVLTFDPPYSPQRYVNAINMFVKEGVKCMIIDSASHEWSGVGGCLDMVKNLGGGFDKWNKVTPMHNEFLQAIISAPIHIIATTRRKQEYTMEENEKGKKTVKKLGLAEVQRDGFEYELTTTFDISIEHYATPSKDRTGLFPEDVPFKISEETGKALANWCQGAG